MLGPAFRVHLEAVPAVEANRSIIVLKNVEPHRQIGTEPADARPHEGIGNAAAVEVRIDHQPVEFAAVGRVHRGNDVTGEAALDERRSEPLVAVGARKERGLGRNANDPLVGIKLLRRQAVAIEGGRGGPLREGSDVLRADPLKRCIIVDKEDQRDLRYRARNAAACSSRR